MPGGVAYVRVHLLRVAHDLVALQLKHELAAVLLQPDVVRLKVPVNDAGLVGVRVLGKSLCVVNTRWSSLSAERSKRRQGDQRSLYYLLVGPSESGAPNGSRP